jgi:carbon storage regulator
VEALSLKEEIMLVLSRKVGEKIVIGDNITVTLVRLAGNRVAIGVDAPDRVRVMRGELAVDGAAPCSTDRSDSSFSDSLAGGSLAGGSLATDALTAESLAP